MENPNQPTKSNWQESIDSFKTIAVEIGNHKVSWEYIGEGLSGDYHSEDLDDIPLLRFYCFKETNGIREEITDGSYCTQFYINTPRHFLMIATLIIFDLLERHEHPKHYLESCSWFNTVSFEKFFKFPYAPIGIADIV
jgi:hypothetical protein